MNKFFLALLLCFAASPAFAQYALIAHTGCNLTGTPSGCTASPTTTTTAGINTTGANLLAFCVTDISGGVTVTDSYSNSYTLINSVNNGAADTVYLYVATGSITVGAGHTATVTDPSSTGYPGATFAAFSGAQASPHDQTGSNYNSSTSSIQPGSITPGVANELLLSCVGPLVLETALAVSSPFTGTDILNFTSTSEGSGMAYQIQTSATAENPTWSWTTAVPALTTLDSFKSGTSVNFMGPTVAGHANQPLVQGLYGGGIALTSQTGAISTATLCGAINCGLGQYRVTAYLASTVSCVTPGSAAVGVTITYTDDAGTKTAVTLPLEDSGAITTPTTTLALGTTTGFGFGAMNFWSSGANPIQYATSYAGCSSGTGTYSIRLGVERLQ